LPPSKRRQYLLAAADAVEARASDIIEAITTEMGGPAAWGKHNVKVLAEKLRFAADGSYQGLTGEVIASGNPWRTMIVIRKPVGVVVSIVPWNAPALLVDASVPAALVLGKTVVVKASEQTPRTHGLVAECFALAGFAATAGQAAQSGSNSSPRCNGSRSKVREPHAIQSPNACLDRMLARGPP
jgi:benzaldehyde dehydrogenase (NAD)